MRQKSFIFLLLIPFVMSCGSGPKPVEQAPAPLPAAPVAQPEIPEPAPGSQNPDSVPVNNLDTQAAEQVFNPESVTEEQYETTKADIQALIGELNRIIRAQNYNEWRGHLADSYFEAISSSKFLEDKTEELYKRDQIVASNMGRDPRRVQKKLLRTPRDYFTNVVVPSRQNDRVDDIDFLSENRVVAYTVDSRGSRLILYDLELINNRWMIIN